jgi:hypothetical protein
MLIWFAYLIEHSDIRRRKKTLILLKNLGVCLIFSLYVSIDHPSFPCDINQIYNNSCHSFEYGSMLLRQDVVLSTSYSARERENVFVLSHWILTYFKKLETLNKKQNGRREKNKYIFTSKLTKHIDIKLVFNSWWILFITIRTSSRKIYRSIWMNTLKSNTMNLFLSINKIYLFTKWIISIDLNI